MKAAVAGRVMVAVAGVLLGGALAVAQGPGDMGPGGMGRDGAEFGHHRPPGLPGRMGQFWNNSRIVAQLKLTDDQRKAMDGILLAHREQLVDLQATLQKAELELEPMIKADQLNENQALAQIDKVAQARANLEKANGRFLLDIRARLTPDQWKQVQDMRANDMRDRQPDGHGQGPRRQWRQRPGGSQGIPPPPPDGMQGPPPPGPGGDQ